MALQSYGILGPVTQKIGNVVGAKWKNRYYFRTLVTPSNPNSVAQQVVRANFAILVAFGRQILGSVLQPYWDPFYSAMSGFNGFMKYNMQAQSGAFDWSLAIVSRGSLEGTTISTATYAAGQVQINFSSTITGNGATDDVVEGVVYDAANNVAFLGTPQERVDSSIVVVVGTGRDEADLHAFVFLHRGSGASLLVSNSDYSAVTT